MINIEMIKIYGNFRPYLINYLPGTRKKKRPVNLLLTTTTADYLQLFYAILKNLSYEAVEKNFLHLIFSDHVFLYRVNGGYQVKYRKFFQKFIILSFVVLGGKVVVVVVGFLL